MEKQNSDKFDNLTTPLLQMQQKLQESLLETRQIQQSQQGNQNSIHISHANNLLYVPHFHDQRFQYTRPPFKMEVPRFDGTDALSWIFKKFQFFNFHNTVKEQRIPIAFILMDQR